ncbi:MAG: hypothetical protein ACRCSK_05975 [Fusobacteriaceae bacterium]
MKKIFSLILIFIISVALFGVTVAVDEAGGNYSIEGNGVSSAENYSNEYYTGSAPTQTYTGNIASNSVGNYSDINYNAVFAAGVVQNSNITSSEAEIIVELKSLYDTDTRWKSDKYEIQLP